MNLRARILFLLIVLLLGSVIVSAVPPHYLRADVINNLMDNSACPGWTDQIQWAIKSGDCSGSGFTPVSCTNDQTTRIDPGQKVRGDCRLDTLPSGDFNTYCMRVIWCDIEKTVSGMGEGTKARLKAGLCSAQPAETDSLSVYAGEEICFDGGLSTANGGTISSFYIDYGDGDYYQAASGEALLSHVYTAAGRYPALLTVTDSQGNHASKAVTIDVSLKDANQVPKALISWYLRSPADYSEEKMQVMPEASVKKETPFYLYAGMSTDPDGKITSMRWELGDGQSQDLQEADFNTILVYNHKTPGRYVVKLTVTDDKGASSSDQLTINVVDGEPNQVPTAMAKAGFQHNPKSRKVSAGIGVNIEFDGSESEDVDGSIVSYSWDYGDGATGSGYFQTHAYASAGQYHPVLTVTDNAGSSSVDLIEVNINSEGQPPVASAKAKIEAGDRLETLSVGVGSLVEFDGSESTDPDGYVLGYSWDYGDGATGSGEKASHPYTSPGTYAAALVVSDNTGKTSEADTVTVTVVQNAPPVASISWTTGDYSKRSSYFSDSVISVDDGTTVYFAHYLSSDPDGDIVRYFWDFGDGHRFDETSDKDGVAPMVVSYGGGSDITVSLKVTDDLGATASNSVKIKVNPVKAQALLQAGVGTLSIGTVSAKPGETVNYDGSKSSSKGTITSYSWDYGDGSAVESSAASAAAHAYASEGIYTAKLTITDSVGDTAYDTVSIIVASIDSGPKEACETFKKTGVLPSKYDWRSVDGKSYMTPPKAQGNCGACWAFSVIGAFEGSYNYRHDTPSSGIDLSEQELISCIPETFGCISGDSQYAANYLKGQGVCGETCFPFADFDVPDNTKTTAACTLKCSDSMPSTVNSGGYTMFGSKAVILNLNNVPVSDNEPTPEEIKEKLICEGPISAMMISWDHGFVIAGYDDDSDICADHYGKKGCFIVKNSWGTLTGSNTYWHVNGYAYIPYEDALSTDGTYHTGFLKVTYYK